jgi:crotonobetainyl-CoA:carnitine CoA-transferase CaiB-like acyl-CoA transferase
VIGRFGSFAADDRFANRRDRAEHADELAADLAKAFLQQPAADWERDLRTVDVACVEVVAGPVEANFLDDGSLGRLSGFVTHTTHPMLDEIPRLAPLVSFSRSATTAKGASLLGQQTDAVLRELGYDDDRIALLRAAGVIGG